MEYTSEELDVLSELITTEFFLDADYSRTDTLSWFTSGGAEIHLKKKRVLEIPLDEIPMYLNSRSRCQRVIVRWRLMIAR